MHRGNPSDRGGLGRLRLYSLYDLLPNDDRVRIVAAVPDFLLNPRLTFLAFLEVSGYLNKISTF